MDPISITVTLDLDQWARGQGWQDRDGEWHTSDNGPLEGWVASQVAAIIASELKSEISKQVTDHVIQVARARAGESVELVMSGPIELTDNYGNSRNDPKTLHQIIVEEATKILSTPVAQNGNWDRRRPALIELICKEIDKTFRSELAPVIAEAKAAATQAVRDRAAEMLAAEMTARR